MAQRTDQQNKALHLFCTQLAEVLNTGGFSVQKTLMQKQLSIPWRGDLVKELLWREVQKAMFDKESTTELSRSEVSQVHEVLMQHLGEKLGVPYVEFPSQDNLER